MATSSPERHRANPTQIWMFQAENIFLAARLKAELPPHGRRQQATAIHSPHHIRWEVGRGVGDLADESRDVSNRIVEVD